MLLKFSKTAKWEINYFITCNCNRNNLYVYEYSQWIPVPGEPCATNFHLYIKLDNVSQLVQFLGTAILGLHGGPSSQAVDPQPLGIDSDIHSNV